MKQITDKADPQFSEEFEAGIRSVIYIRCIEHRMVPAYNHNESGGAECAACAIQKLELKLTYSQRQSTAFAQDAHHEAVLCQKVEAKVKELQAELESARPILERAAENLYCADSALMWIQAHPKEEQQ